MLSGAALAYDQNSGVQAHVVSLYVLFHRVLNPLAYMHSNHHSTTIWHRVCLHLHATRFVKTWYHYPDDFAGSAYDTGAHDDAATHVR